MTADILAMLDAAAARYGLDPSLVVAVAQQESGGNPNAVSSAGAQGVMQLMPATAASLGVTDPFDPAQNIDAGVRYLSQLLREFGTIPTALAAYNFGPGNVSAGKTWPAETVTYVSSILSKVGSAIASPFSSSSDQSASPTDSNVPGTSPDTGGLVVLAIVGGLVLWALGRAFSS